MSPCSEVAVNEINAKDEGEQDDGIHEVPEIFEVFLAVQDDIADLENDDQHECDHEDRIFDGKHRKYRKYRLSNSQSQNK